MAGFTSFLGLILGRLYGTDTTLWTSKAISEVVVLFSARFPVGFTESSRTINAWSCFLADIVEAFVFTLIDLDD
jgi:hypothetical protein